MLAVHAHSRVSSGAPFFLCVCVCVGVQKSMLPRAKLAGGPWKTIFLLKGPASFHVWRREDTARAGLGEVILFGIGSFSCSLYLANWIGLGFEPLFCFWCFFETTQPLGGVLWQLTILLVARSFWKDNGRATTSSHANQGGQLNLSMSSWGNKSGCQGLTC